MDLGGLTQLFARLLHFVGGYVPPEALLLGGVAVLAALAGGVGRVIAKRRARGRRVTGGSASAGTVSLSGLTRRASVRGALKLEAVGEVAGDRFRLAEPLRFKHYVTGEDVEWPAGTELPLDAVELHQT